MRCMNSSAEASRGHPGRYAVSRSLGPAFLVGIACVVVGRADTWPMHQRDMQHTGRADFTVPASRLNNSFFDVIRWQKPSPGSPVDGDFDSGSMSFFDGAGPGGADIMAAGYHWPKGVQGMDRLTGRRFWWGNPSGGETVGAVTPAFNADGSVIYITNDATDTTTMAFFSATGPGAYWGSSDNLLSGRSPMVAPDGRIFLCPWNDRPYAGTDYGDSIPLTWSAGDGNNTCFIEPALYDYPGVGLRVVVSGRSDRIKSFNGTTGALVWSTSNNIGAGTDVSPTIDPANGDVYCAYARGDNGNVYVLGLNRDGNQLWTAPARQIYSYGAGANIYGWGSTGCLSHDGGTYYFQISTHKDWASTGRLFAVNTATGALRWSYLTGSAGAETGLACPIVTSNGVIIVGNNYGGMYRAIRDNGTSATLLDSFAVDASGAAQASPTLSTDGLLYLPLRTPWIASNGNTDVPTLNLENVYTAFDLNDGAQMYVPIPEGTLPAPTGLAVTPFYSTAYVQWNAVADPSVAGYVLYRRPAAGGYTVPVKRVLRTSFTDYDLTPGQTYYYEAMAVDGSGVPVSHLSAEVGATLDDDPSLYSTHHSFEVLMAFYKGGWTTTQVNQLTEGLKRALEFYWRTSVGRLNMDVTWIYIDGNPPADQWGTAVENDLRSRGVYDGQFDLAYLVGNGLAGCLGGYIVFGNTPAALGVVCGVPYPGKDPNTDYTITWSYTHEMHHALEVMENITAGTPEVLFDHFPWCYPDPLGPTGWHMDWGSHYDGIGLTNREYGDQWTLYPPPYDGYIECVDADGDSFPDSDARVWMDEVRFGSSALTPDTDGDGLDDLAEFSAYNFRGTDPNDTDTDNDGLLDGADPRPLYPVREVLPHVATPPVIDGVIEASWPVLRSSGYYFTQNSTDFTLRTYCGWDANALYVAVESTRQLRFMLSVDGSGQDGRFESPVRYITGTTSTLGPDNKDQQIGDSWGDGNHIHWDYGAATAEVFGRGTIPGSVVASTHPTGWYRTEVKIPRALPAGAAYTWYPAGVGTPVVDGLTLWPGHVIGLSLTVSNYSGSNGGEFSGIWTGLFETHAYVDFVLQLPGDANCDGAVDFDDINPFVAALVSREGYESLYPECTWFDGDCNDDGTVDFDDINPFVTLLVGP